MKKVAYFLRSMCKRLVLLLILATPLYGIAQQSDSSAVYIPVDLEDCMRQLDSLLSLENKNWIRAVSEEEFVNSQHFSLGIWMRNNWRLWGNSRLKNYFNEQGIHHPDDMSGVILQCYYHFAKGEKVDYKKILRDERKAEKAWLKQIQETNDEDWEYEERYFCPDAFDTLSSEAISEFLGLPRVADNVTGVQVRIRKWGESIEEDLLHVEECLNRPPRRVPIKNGIVDYSAVHYGFNHLPRLPNGKVKRILITEVEEHGMVELGFNPDGSPSYFRQRKSSRCNDVYYEYCDGHISRVIEYWDDTLHSVRLYRFSDPYHCQELEYGAARWRDLAPYNDTISQAQTISKVILSPEGQVLAIMRPWGCSIFQYDSLGREVTWLSSDNGRTLMDFEVIVYDDEHHVFYEYQGYPGIYAKVLDAHGGILGQCCAQLLGTFDNKKTMFRYRYDRHGNWTHMYEKGKLMYRCKIWYY